MINALVLLKVYTCNMTQVFSKCLSKFIVDLSMCAWVITLCSSDCTNIYIVFDNTFGLSTLEIDLGPVHCKLDRCIYE